MSERVLEKHKIANMFLSGANSLNAKKDYINELNVFPVPDGDTGTNMSMTILSAAKEVQAVADKTNIDDVCKAIASGSLKGARGNSGVILSQLLRGFTKYIADIPELGAPELAAAFNKAVETAYKAVMKPKEGTILTVARGMAEKASEICDTAEGLDTFFDEVVAYGNEVLSKTPDMLPVLKQAGVVDSGGQGLMEIMKGAADFYAGRITEEEFVLELSDSTKKAETAKGAAMSESDIIFGYCTEFIIMLEKAITEKAEKAFKDFLESIGDSIVCVAMDDIVKVHVHTNDPGLAIQRALKLGELSNIKIDNMRLEHRELVIKSGDIEKTGASAEMPAKEEEKLPYGFISISAGDGLDKIFESFGVNYIIPGGQTMNPSTEDMLNAIDNINSDTIYILPNNKNIILAANQAREMVSDKEIIVIPTKTVPQGIAALINFMPEADAQQNSSAMTEAAESIKTGQITYAVRDTVIDDKTIHQNDIMGIGDSTILAVGTDISEVAVETLAGMIDEESAFISIYYGDEVSETDAEKLLMRLTESYPNMDIELNYGGQPVYYYILSVE